MLPGRRPSPAADAVLEARRARGSPTGGPASPGRAGTAGSGRRLGRGSARWRTRPQVGQVVDVGDQPRLGAVGQVAVGEQDHRRAVGERDPGRLDRRVEAVGRGLRRDDRHRRLAVAAEHRLQQVGLLGLGRQAGRRAAALHVDDHSGSSSAITASRSSRTSARCPGRTWWSRRARRRTPRRAPRRSPAISSSAWKVVTPKFLCLDSSCRMSEAGVIGYAPRNSGSFGPAARRDQAVGQREVAGDVAVGAGRHLGRLDLVRTAKSSVVSPKFQPALNAAMLASRCRASWRTCARGTARASLGRPVYIQDSRPSANMFLPARRPCDRPNVLQRLDVSEVSATGCTL
jgi:hypothetical protein